MKDNIIFEQVLCQYCDKNPYYATVILTDESLTVNNDLILSYLDIAEITCSNYTIALKSASHLLTFRELGYAFEQFISSFYQFYNNYLMRGYYTHEPLAFTCEGEYAFGENQADAEIRLYPSSICVLPVNGSPIRYPLCFIKEVQSLPYDTQITDDDGLILHVRRLGYQQDSFNYNLKKLRDQQAKSTLTRLQLLWNHSDLRFENVTHLLLEGKCASMHVLEEACAGFSSMFDEFAAGLTIHEEYAFLRELGEKHMAVGVLRNASRENPAMWFAVPFIANHRHLAAIEVMAPDQPDAATYLYRADDFETFLHIASHAMEAADYRREPIRIPDRDITAEDQQIVLALRLNPSLEKLRSMYLGRAIHRSLDSWKKSILSCQS